MSEDVRRLEVALARAGIDPEDYARDLLVAAERRRFDKESEKDNGRREAEKQLADTEYLVEASSYESLCCWLEWADNVPKDSRTPRTLERERASWVQDFVGWAPVVGHINKRPICVSLHWQTIDGARVCFFEVTSQLADHLMVETWLKARTPKLVRSTDSLNFHNVMLDIRERKAARVS